MKDMIKASEAAPAKTQLSSDTARMFDLINQIGAIHEELRGIYEGTYMITGKWMKRWGMLSMNCKIFGSTAQPMLCGITFGLANRYKKRMAKKAF